MARLSLCVIARDEQEFLPGCLESVRGVVDEIVLVDTGSRDATLTLARAAGARVLELPWEGDFSAPRNVAVEHAKGDWILQLDADERLAPGAGDAVRAALRGARFDVGFLPLHNASRLDAPPAEVVSGRARIGEPARLPRLLRRSDGLRYEGVVHENVSSWFRRRGGRGEEIAADIVHLGCVEAVREARGKRARNTALLRARIAADPGDVTALGYLAMELYEGDQLDEALAVAEQGWAIREAAAAHTWLGRLGVARALVALKRGHPDRALETVEWIERREGPSADTRFLCGAAAEILALRSGAGDAERAALLGRAVDAQLAALAAVRARGQAVFLVAVPGTILIRLGVALRLLGRNAEAIAAFETARSLGEGVLGAWGEADARVASGDPGRALALLERALDAKPDGWVIAAAAADALGATADARTFLGEAARRARGGFAMPHLRERLPALERVAGRGQP